MQITGLSCDICNESKNQHIMSKFIFILFSTFSIVTLIDFDTETDLQGWYLQNDTVMGGRSDSSFMIDEQGHAIFEGNVSLKNNGGFASIQYEKHDFLIGDATRAVLRVKGDGKTYKLRLKKDIGHLYEYEGSFTTKNTGEWEDVEVLLENMKAVYRGRNLDMGPLKTGKIDRMGILIGNKKAESFKLVIDYIQFQ